MTSPVTSPPTDADDSSDDAADATDQAEVAEADGEVAASVEGPTPEADADPADSEEKDTK